MIVWFFAGLGFGFGTAVSFVVCYLVARWVDGKVCSWIDRDDDE